MNLVSLFFLLIATVTISNAEKCTQSMKNVNTKLFCYYSKLRDVNSCKCTHVVLPANSDVKSIENLRSRLNGVKILVTVHEFNEGLVDLLKKTKVDGLEVDLKKLDSKNDIADFISTARSKLGSDLYTAVSIPSHADLLAKYYDFKGLTKHVDNYILQTAFLGASTNVTFHPSRLSGLWDMQNADSVVDLVTGLGAPISKLVIAAPIQAFQFKLQDEKHTAPGSPALEVKSITRGDLCKKMTSANWTLERDQDQAGPYIFRKNQWIAFDDPMSMDIKAKYARVRGLAGLALKDLSQDGGEDCGGLLLEAAYNGLSKQSRAPRGAVLQSLEREILTPAQHHNNIQVSPYRITRIIDTEGKIHAVRQDTRTEFECSRQGYFVHPRSCNRFYRCVKFNQLSDEYNVFEFDCPAGLAFDSRVEVCVWPGSLPDGSACSGSSEIAPVPKERFVCPHEPGYYADPENCRWFFACLDHGQDVMTPYEFRCPFGLVFDQDRLLCEWPWLVPKCASGYATSGVLVEFHGGAYGTHGGVVGVNGVVDAHGSFGVGGHGLIGVHGGGSQGGVILENYNGLGVLQPVTLGGLHGPISEPVAKVYSSFGSRGSGGHGIGAAGHELGVGTVDQGGVLLGANIGHTLVGANIQDGEQNIGIIGNQHGVAGHGGGAVLVGTGGGAIAGHGLGGSGIAQGSLLAGIGSGSGIESGHGAVLVGVDHGANAGENLVGVNIQGGHQDVLLTQGLGQLDTSHRGSIKYQGGIADANLSGGKSTVTYHGNLASLANLGSGGYSGGPAYVEGERILSTTQNLHDGANLGIGVVRGGHRGSARYQGVNAGLDGHLGGAQSTVTYHGNFGGAAHGDQILVDGVSSKGGIIATDGGHYNAGQDGVVLVQDGGAGHVGVGQVGVGQVGVGHLGVGHVGVGQVGVGHIGVGQVGVGQVGQGIGLAFADQFGQRGKFISDDLGGKSTVSYHGNFGKSRQNLFDQGSYTINAPIDRASLVFGTKLRGSKIGDGALIEGQKFASTYIQDGQDRSDDSGLKFTNQVLVGGQGVVGHDLGAVGVTTIHGGDERVVLTGEGVGRVGSGATGLHSVGVGLDSADIGLQQSSVTLHGNQGASQDGVIVHGGVLHGPTEPSVGQIDIAVNKGDALNINRGSLHYNTDNNLGGAVLLNQGQGGSTSSSYQNFNTKHKSGRVNIVGGGFSAVGVYPNTYKQSTAAIQTVTASPISPISVTPVSVTASPIPVVTSVPIPITHTNDNLDIYNGNGVVANVPELQVKVETPSAAFIPNVQRTHIASTGAALDVENGGYVYDKPAVAYVDHGASRLVEDSGAKSFIHQRIEHQQPVAIGVTPTVAVEPVSLNIPQKPAVSTYHIQQTGTTQYTNPSLEIQDHKVLLQPQVNIHQTPIGITTVGDHSGGSYSYQNLAKSTVIEGVTPSVLLDKKISGPAPTISTVHFGTALVDDHQPSVVVQHIGEPVFKQPGGSIEVSTVRPVSFGNIGHKTIESVTPSVLVQPFVQTAKPILVENITPAVPFRPVFRQKVRPIKPAVSSVHFGTTLVENVTPSVLLQSHGEPLGAAEVSTVAPVSYSTLQHVSTGSIEHATPSIVTQPIFQQQQPAVNVAQLQPVINVASVQPAVNLGKIQPAVSYSSVNFGAGHAIEPIHAVQGVEINKQVTADVIETVTPSVVVQQPILEQQIIPQGGGSSYFHQRNDFTKSGNLHSVTPSPLPSASFSFQSLPARGFEKQLHVGGVTTPSSILVEQERTDIGDQTGFLSSVSKSRGFSKFGQVESVTPSILVQDIPHVQTNTIVGDIGHGSYSFGSANSRGFAKFGQVTPSVTPVPILDVQPVQHTVISEGVVGDIGHGSFPFESAKNRGFSKFDQITPTVTPATILNVQPVQHTLTSQGVVGDIGGDIGHGSYSFESAKSRGFAEFGQVTPVPLLDVQPVQHTVISEGVVGDIGHGSYSFESAKNRGFSKFDQITPTVTPATILNVQPVQHTLTSQEVIGDINGDIGHGSYSFESAKSRGFAKFGQVTPSVTPVPVLDVQPVQHTVISEGVVGDIGHGSYSFESAKNRGFAKFGQVTPSVTPVPVLNVQPVQHTLTSQGVVGDIGHGSYSFESAKNRGFAKFAQITPTVTPATILDVQPVQHTIISDGVGDANLDRSYSYQNSRHRGSVKYTPQVIQTVTSQPILQHQTFGTALDGHVQDQGQNLLGTFAYEGFGVKTQTPSVAIDNPQKSLYRGSGYYEGHQQSAGYDYRRPTVAFSEGPIVSQDYDSLEPVKEEPFVAKKAYVTGNTINEAQKAHVVYEENYPSVTVSPIVSSPPVFVTSTLKPSYQSTIQSVYNTIPSTTVKPLKFFYHDSRLSSTPRPFEFKSNLPASPVTTPQVVISSTPKPIIPEIPVSVDYDAGIGSPIAPIGVTQSKPIFKYSFSSLDSQYSSTPAPIDLSPIEVTRRPILNRVRVTTPIISTYQPAIIKSTTIQPLLDISSPSGAYFPAAGIVENYQAPILKSRKVLKVVQPTSKAIVKINDFHPLLSAKLGAQCTCIADSVRLRNKPVKVSIDDGEHIEEFVVKPDNSQDLLSGVVEGQSFKDAYIGDGGLVGGENAIVVPEYEPQQVVAITPLPEITIGSTTAAPISRTPVVVRKRVRVRPVPTTPAYIEAPVTRVTDLFLKSTPLIDDYQLNVADQAINSDLNIIKPGPAGILNAHNFDRYGPGGLRSKTETLQGTIDCQRAGLFRHPTQCNKFYSCRWDCTKNKFTLHIFNCPVHLTFDDSLGACNWPSQGPACLGNTLLPSD